MKGKLISNFELEANVDLNIPLVGLEETAKCLLNIQNDKNGNLICQIDLEKYSNSDYTYFSFKKSKYEDEYMTIILSGIDEVHLINKKSVGSNEKEGKNGKGYLMYIYIGAGAAGAIGIIITIILCVKKKGNNPIVQGIVNNLNMIQNPNGINPMKIGQNIIRKSGKKNSKKISKKGKKKNSINLSTNVDNSKNKLFSHKSKKK